MFSLFLNCLHCFISTSRRKVWLVYSAFPFFFPSIIISSCFPINHFIFNVLQLGFPFHSPQHISKPFKSCFLCFFLTTIQLRISSFSSCILCEIPKIHWIPYYFVYLSSFSSLLVHILLRLQLFASFYAIQNNMKIFFWLSISDNSSRDSVNVPSLGYEKEWQMAHHHYHTTCTGRRRLCRGWVQAGCTLINKSPDYSTSMTNSNFVSSWRWKSLTLDGIMITKSVKAFDLKHTSD